MIGLMTVAPRSRACANASSDQSAHFGSSVRTSRSTHESTSVTRFSETTRNEPLLATEQFHQLIRAHRRRCTPTHTCGETLAPPLRPLPTHYPQRIADLDHLDLVPLFQRELPAQFRGNGHLPLAVEPHRGTSFHTYYVRYVILSPRRS